MIQFLAGGGLTLAGLLLGRFMPARQKASRDPEPICKCNHPLSDHHPQTNICGGVREVGRYNSIGHWVGKLEKPCTCQQYVGPRPLETYYAPEITE